MKAITISREFGAGGHSIGMELSKRLNIPFYDWDIVIKMTKETGRDVVDNWNSDEEISPIETFVRRITPVAYDATESTFEVEKQIIIDLAKKGPCIFLGRCSDQILKDAGIDAFHVFLYASTEHRVDYLKNLAIEKNEKISDPVKELKKHDHNRVTYYERFTGKTFGDYHNYDFMVDTSLLGYDESVSLIEKAYNAIK